VKKRAKPTFGKSGANPLLEKVEQNRFYPRSYEKASKTHFWKKWSKSLAQPLERLSG
jgi:hypothetical protein